MAENQSPSHKIFISYAHQDRITADLIIERLEELGLSCWVSHRDASPGAEWAASIVDAISVANVIVLIYSGQSNTSQQVLREMERGVSRDKIIIPFLIETAPLSKSMEYFLGATHWLDASEMKLESAIDYLADRINILFTKDDGSELKPTRIELPIPTLLFKIYWACIIVGLLFLFGPVFIELSNFSLSETWFVYSSFVYIPTLAFGITGLLWGRQSWQLSFVVAIICTGVLFVFFVAVFPFL